MNHTPSKHSHFRPPAPLLNSRHVTYHITVLAQQTQDSPRTFLHVDVRYIWRHMKHYSLHRRANDLCLRSQELAGFFVHVDVMKRQQPMNHSAPRSMWNLSRLKETIRHAVHWFNISKCESDDIDWNKVFVSRFCISFTIIIPCKWSQEGKLCTIIVYAEMLQHKQVQTQAIGISTRRPLSCNN